MESEMIYTVTFNPSLDYVVRVGGFRADTVNRTLEEHIYPGGKGNNVAVIASGLGMRSRALGFKAGFTGEAMEQMLRERGCDTDFIALDEGVTRINVKVKSGNEFEINGQGPMIPEEKVRQLYEKLQCMGHDDVLVLSGSIPNTLPDDLYEQILMRFSGSRIRTCVDAAGSLLIKALKYRPFLIKPNSCELEELFGVKFTSDNAIVEHARRLQDIGARNVLVSMAGDGAVLVSEDGRVFQQLPPAGRVVNSVGAGDSMVAGFLTGYLQSGDFEEALRLGTAAGSATAFTSWLADADQIMEIYRKLSKTK